MEQTLQKLIENHLRGSLTRAGLPGELARPAMRMLAPQFTESGVMPDSVLLRISRDVELTIRPPRELREAANGLREIPNASV